MPATQPKLITSEQESKVYLLKKDKKYWVVNEETIASLGFVWDDIESINATELQKIPSGFPISAVGQQVFETPAFICCIEKSWSDNFSLGVIGWVVGKKEPIKKFKVKLDGKENTVTHWLERPEISDYFSGESKQFAVPLKCGFQITIPKHAPQKIELSGNGGAFSAISIAPSPEKIIHPGLPLSNDIEATFRKLVNDNHLSVLEVGSRISPGGTNKRTFFKNAGSYTGVDYIDGETVDVVGDAHELSKLFPRKKFDALYSDSVLEHLAAPWKAVIEMNKVLKEGGYVYHSAPSAWPLHDMPWDFWRFSHAGFKALFSEAFGFRVLGTGYTVPMSMHIDYGQADDAHATLPLAPAFGFVCILAQKTHDVNRIKTRFNHPLEKLVDKDSTYPAWDSKK